MIRHLLKTVSAKGDPKTPKGAQSKCGAVGPITEVGRTFVTWSQDVSCFDCGGSTHRVKRT